MACRCLSVHGKQLDHQDVRRIGLHCASDNPLFLSVLLAELTVFGEFFELQTKLDQLLQAKDLKTLLAQVMPCEHPGRQPVRDTHTAEEIHAHWQH